MKETNFRTWVESHDPKTKWDWNNYNNIHDQFITVVQESGSIDLETVFELFFAEDNSGLSYEENKLWLNKILN